MAQNIPKDFIDSLIEKVNIVDVIGNYIKLETLNYKVEKDIKRKEENEKDAKEEIRRVLEKVDH